MEQGNRTKGLLQSEHDTTARSAIDGEAMIAVKPTNSLEPLIWIRAADFDCVAHYRLSEEEIRAIGEPKSKRWFES